MVKCWKDENGRVAYDTVSGAVIKLNTIEFKLVNAIVLPLTPVCPSSLRYELAKYDAADVEEAYDHIYALHQKNILFAGPEQTSDQYMRVLGGEYGLKDKALISGIKQAINGQKTTIRCENDVPEAILTAFSK